MWDERNSSSESRIQNLKVEYIFLMYIYMTGVLQNKYFYRLLYRNLGCAYKNLQKL